MVRIYTRSGDKGMTSLVYGKRVAKNNLRVEAYGTVDEANAMIGLALSHLTEQDKRVMEDNFVTKLHRIQTILFHVGAELSTPSDKEVVWKLKEEHITELEEQIDLWDEHLPGLKNFILPSGHPTAAALHTARAIVRRAERLSVGLKDELGDSYALPYLNRLSDYLFVAARYVNFTLGKEELPLQPDE